MTPVKKSLTLIELITVIVVMGLAVPALVRMFFEANIKQVRTESIATATFYAEKLIEEIRWKRFDEDETLPWSEISELGPDTSTTGLDGETLENDSDHWNWDDVDDYHGYSDSFSNYSRSVLVEYLELNNEVWEPASGVTDYKKITVSVSRAGKGFSRMELVLIMSSY